MEIIRKAKPVPVTFVNKTIVNERVKNFQNLKLPGLSQAIGKSDSSSAWYSLEQFEELIREMYYQNADGLRIYFGAYGDNDPEYAKQLTVIFVPTFLNEATGKHRDIVIDDGDLFDERLGLPKNLDTIGLCPPACFDHELAYPYDEQNIPQ